MCVRQLDRVQKVLRVHKCLIRLKTTILENCILIHGNIVYLKGLQPKFPVTTSSTCQDLFQITVEKYNLVRCVTPTRQAVGEHVVGVCSIWDERVMSLAGKLLAKCQMYCGTNQPSTSSIHQLINKGKAPLPTKATTVSKNTHT
jgi:hypothetical protein